MADDDKPTTAKRPARKRATRTATPPNDTTAEASGDTTEPEAAPDAPESVAEPAGGLVTVTAEPNADVPDDDDDLGSHGDAGEGDDSLLARRRAEVLELGILTVHYAARDVAFLLDGRCAARVMAVYAGTMGRHLAQDLLLPGFSDMRNLWATISLDGVLGMTWMPGLPSAGPRTMTVDPPPPPARA